VRRSDPEVNPDKESEPEIEDKHDPEVIEPLSETEPQSREYEVGSGEAEEVQSESIIEFEEVEASETFSTHNEIPELVSENEVVQRDISEEQEEPGNSYVAVEQEIPSAAYNVPSDESSESTGVFNGDVITPESDIVQAATAVEHGESVHFDGDEAETVSVPVHTTEVSEREEKISISLPVDTTPVRREYDITEVEQKSITVELIDIPTSVSITEEQEAILGEHVSENTVDEVVYIPDSEPARESQIARKDTREKAQPEYISAQSVALEDVTLPRNPEPFFGGKLALIIPFRKTEQPEVTVSPSVPELTVEQAQVLSVAVEPGKLTVSAQLKAGEGSETPVETVAPLTTVTELQSALSYITALESSRTERLSERVNDGEGEAPKVDVVISSDMLTVIELFQADSDFMTESMLVFDANEKQPIRFMTPGEANRELTLEQPQVVILQELIAVFTESDEAATARENSLPLSEPEPLDFEFIVLLKEVDEQMVAEQPELKQEVSEEFMAFIMKEQVLVEALLKLTAEIEEEHGEEAEESQEITLFSGEEELTIDTVTLKKLMRVRTYKRQLNEAVATEEREVLTFVEAFTEASEDLRAEPEEGSMMPLVSETVAIPKMVIGEDELSEIWLFMRADKELFKKDAAVIDGGKIGALTEEVTQILTETVESSFTVSSELRVPVSEELLEFIESSKAIFGTEITDKTAEEPQPEQFILLYVGDKEIMVDSRTLQRLQKLFLIKKKVMQLQQVTSYEGAAEEVQQDITPFQAGADIALLRVHQALLYMLESQAQQEYTGEIFGRYSPSKSFAIMTA
jgi:hypothetical protein